MAKVTVSTKIDEELKDKLEALAKEKQQTLSQLLGEKLKQSIEKEESSFDEYNLIKTELAEKNKQIERLNKHLDQQQEISLYDKKEAVLLLENFKTDETEDNELKKELDKQGTEIVGLREQLSSKEREISQLEEQKRKDKWKFWKR